MKQNTETDRPTPSPLGEGRGEALHNRIDTITATFIAKGMSEADIELLWHNTTNAFIKRLEKEYQIDKTDLTNHVFHTKKDVKTIRVHSDDGEHLLLVIDGLPLKVKTLKSKFLNRIGISDLEFLNRRVAR